MIFPFDDCKFRSLGNYLRWKLGVPSDAMVHLYEPTGWQGTALTPQLAGRFFVGDVVKVGDISIEKVSPFKYFVRRGYRSWSVWHTGSEYQAAVDAVASLDCPPKDAKAVLF